MAPMGRNAGGRINGVPGPSEPWNALTVPSV